MKKLLAIVSLLALSNLATAKDSEREVEFMVNQHLFMSTAIFRTDKEANSETRKFETMPNTLEFIPMWRGWNVYIYPTAYVTSLQVGYNFTSFFELGAGIAYTSNSDAEDTSSSHAENIYLGFYIPLPSAATLELTPDFNITHGKAKAKVESSEDVSDSLTFTLIAAYVHPLMENISVAPQGLVWKRWEKHQDGTKAQELGLNLMPLSLRFIF